MLTITKSFEFCSSHNLNNPAWSNQKNCEEFGKCSNVHGHNYCLEVSISGEVNPQTGMIINLSTLDNLVKEEIISQLDHKHLNSDVEWLKSKIVSLENVLETIWQKLDLLISTRFPSVTLQELILKETSRIYAKRAR